MARSSPLVTWLLLALGPLLALLLSNAALSRWGPFWALLLTLPQGSSHRSDALLHQTEHTDVAIIGSSVAVHGVSAPALSGLLGKEVVNLGRNGASLVSSAMLVPRLVDASPQQVILLLSPMELQPRDEPDWQRSYDPYIAAELLGASGWVSHPRAHLQGLARWASLLYRHTPGVRAALGAPLPDDPMSHPEGAVAFMQRTREELASLQPAAGLNLDALRTIARRLSEAGVQLIACPAPLHPALRDRSSEQAVFDTLLKARSTEAPMVVISPRRLGRFAPELFMDPFHLTRKASAG